MSDYRAGQMWRATTVEVLAAKYVRTPYTRYHRCTRTCLGADARRPWFVRPRTTAISLHFYNFFFRPVVSNFNHTQGITRLVSVIYL